jgi:hypothetical protein
MMRMVVEVVVRMTMNVEEKLINSKLLVLTPQGKESIRDFGIGAGMDTTKILYDYLNWTVLA